MMMQKRIADATAAEAVVRRVLDDQYGNKLKVLSFRKCWYSAAGKQEFWDVEGTLIRKKGILGSEARNFRYQVDPDTGNIIGYEFNIPGSHPEK